jgi:hypothetical protein
MDCGDRVSGFSSRSGCARDQAARRLQIRILPHARGKGSEAVWWDTEGKGREVKGSGRTKSIEGEYISQLFQRGLDIREFEEDGSVRDMLIVEHEADAPDNGREADVLGAGQVVQNDLGLGLGGHVVLCFNENLVEEI